MRYLACVLIALGSGACLVRRAPPTMPPPEPVHETRRNPPKGDDVDRVESSVVVMPDGETLRDGPEREYLADGTLEAERHYQKGRPVGVWRAWFPDGRLRSEVDFGDGHGPASSRYWHPGGVLAAEGTTVGGIRQGAWSYWDEEGRLLRQGGYEEGERSGPWVFWEEGRKVAEGRYEAGQRVGDWTLWDAQGVAHVRSGGDGKPPPRPRP